MAPSDQSAANNQASKASGDADLAQAYRDLARGEQTATALEANLSNLESKLDAILAALEARADPQAPTSATAAEAEGPVETSDQADRHAEAKEGADKDKHKGKEDTA